MPTPPDTAQDQVDARLGTVVSYARAQIGKPYVFGAVGPNSFDCSGLVVAAYRQVGLQLVHWTGALIATGEEVTKSDLQLGDLVFPDSGHVQIYSGNGNVIEAPQKGQKVQEHAMGGFWRARRVIGGGSRSAGVVETVAGVVNEFSPLDNALALAKTANRVLENLSNIQFWARIGQYMVGVSLLIVGMMWLFRRPLMQGAGMVGRQIESLAGSFVGGAAFGLGAKSGGGSGTGAVAQIGAQPSPSPSRVPSPPQLASAQTTSAPVTAINPVSPYRTQAFVGTAPMSVANRKRRRPLGTFDPNAGATPKKRKGKGVIP